MTTKKPVGCCILDRQISAMFAALISIMTLYIRIIGYANLTINRLAVILSCGLHPKPANLALADQYNTGGR